MVIEELLTGPEISVLAFSDGYTIVPLPAAQDHKRIGDGDVGPNTGGMGAYAPAPVATPAILEQLMSECLQPTIDGMRKEGSSFESWATFFTDRSYRIPICGYALHRIHADAFWTESPRIQCQVWRPRDRSPHDAFTPRCRPGCHSARTSIISPGAKLCRLTTRHRPARNIA